MQQKLRCQLLCEDRTQEKLFRPILERLFRRVYVEPRRAHGGASFVLQSLPNLCAYIRQRPQEAVGLLVVLDGDATGLAGRIDEVRAAGGLTGSTWESRIATCIPTRNVETWMLWLCGLRGLDESTDYKRVYEREVESGSMNPHKAVAAWFSPLAPEEQSAEELQLPALAHGRKEIDRLCRHAKE